MARCSLHHDKMTHVLKMNRTKNSRQEESERLIENFVAIEKKLDVSVENSTWITQILCP